VNAHADDIIALYERHAHHYEADRRQDPRLEKGWLDHLISLLPRGATVLDIGCGHGEPIARYLIEQGLDVGGVDASPTLIGLCRNRFPNRKWLVADMRTLNLGQTFQGLVAWDSFFHLAHDDQRRMFPIFRSHAALGSALLFTSGPSHGESIGSYHSEPLYHASLSASEYRLLLESNGFTVRAHITRDPNCGLHTVWLAQVER
jgi:SAM-dependent methyltransferase